MFLGTKGVDITKLNETLQPLYNVQTIQGGPEAISESNIEEFLKLERTTALLNVAEKTSANVNGLSSSFIFIVDVFQCLFFTYCLFHFL